MKKFLIFVTSLVTCLAFMLGGCDCSCSQSIPLSFNELHYGSEGKSPSVGYSQTLTYDVDYRTQFGSSFKKDATITDSVIAYDFTGSYVMDFEVLSSLPAKSVIGQNQQIKSNLRSQLEQDNALIYSLHTRLDVTATYDIPGKDQEVRQDFIESITYFTSGKTSFTPIFSQTISDYSAIGFTEEQTVISKITSNSYTTYNQDDYVMTTKYGDEQPITRTFDYERGQVIDNSQLLFVMRNLGLATNDKYQLPVVSYQYGESKILAIVNDGIGTGEQTVNHQLKVNGEDYTEDSINVKRYTYRLSDIKTAGIEQFVYVQNGACGNLGNRSVMYQYVEPLSSIGKIKPLGALVYTLTSADFSE